MEKKKCTSYKAMLRDRVPHIVNLALKWCKAKDCWINHVYTNFIGIYIDNDSRYEATRIALGISSKYRNFDFHKTIDWENLTKEEKESWENVESWVKWFQNTYLLIEDSYKLNKNLYNRDEMLIYITDKYINIENEELAYKLAEYILNSL